MTDTPPIDTTVAHSARVWNYWLGGKDNYPVDRELGEQIERAFPEIVEIARAERAFLVRVVTHLAREHGVRQFLDIGTGLPTVNNTHEVAQSVAPDARVVYVDNDPMVLAHARALLTGVTSGTTHYIDADLREPEALLGQVRQHLDFGRPIALTCLGTLGHQPVEERTHEIVRTYQEALPSGSFFAMCDSTNTGEAIVAATAAWNEGAAIPYHLRGVKEIEAFFDGLELLEPGVCSIPFWRPDPAEVGEVREIAQFGGVGRKP
ncbi:SAM-dependent methyltransferase [Nocardiopsis lucentensis]|uniref:SAM-dependent methyltransferase n=1 Tax=Nocardiopsis lucentensis TaxID=53441 RepID=UPI0003493C59|nr:SAM-dependent methyltransferase [Nocardiopsis lucentensis]